MREIYFNHMQRQDVNDLVANIQQTVQKIIDEMHEYLRGFVQHTYKTNVDNVSTMNKLYVCRAVPCGAVSFYTYAIGVYTKRNRICFAENYGGVVEM